EFDGAQWTNHSLGSDKRYNYITTLLADGDTLWVGQLSSAVFVSGSNQSAVGLLEFDMQSKSVLEEYSVTPLFGRSVVALDWVSALALDGDELIIGTRNSGLHSLDRFSGSLFHYNSNIIGSNAITAIAIVDDQIWTGNGSTGQSFLADNISQGVTGARGYVWEPNAPALGRPDIRVERYMAGYNLAETFFMAGPFIGAQEMVVGDPKVAPYEGEGLPNINFAHLGDNFLEPKLRALKAFPFILHGRVSTPTGSGRYTLEAIDGAKTILLQEGPVTVDKTVGYTMVDKSILETLYHLPFEISLKVYDDSHYLVAEDKYENITSYPDVTKMGRITSPAAYGTFEPFGIISIKGTARFPYRIQYRYAKWVGDRPAYTDGVTVTKGGADPITEVGVLGEIDLDQAVANMPEDFDFLKIELVV